MKERATLFFREIARSSARPSASEALWGRSNSPANRMFCGTAASISSSIALKPTSCSIAFASSAFGPIWREAKEPNSVAKPGRASLCMREITKRESPFKGRDTRFAAAAGHRVSDGARGFLLDRLGLVRLRRLIGVVSAHAMAFQLRANRRQVFAIARFHRAKHVHRGDVDS